MSGKEAILAARNATKKDIQIDVHRASVSLAGARTWLQSKGLGDKQDFDSPSEASTYLLLCPFLSFLSFFSFFPVFFFQYYCFIFLSLCSLRSLLLFFLSVSFFCSFWFLLVLFLPSCLFTWLWSSFSLSPAPFCQHPCASCRRCWASVSLVSWLKACRAATKREHKKLHLHKIMLSWCGYGWIPIHTIFRGMNIHKSQLFWCELQGYKVLTHCNVSFLALCSAKAFKSSSCNIPAPKKKPCWLSGTSGSAVAQRLLRLSNLKGHLLEPRMVEQDISRYPFYTCKP